MIQVTLLRETADSRFPRLNKNIVTARLF